MQTGDQPSWGNTTLGDIAVDGFFVLSGFLVTGSYERLDRRCPAATWAVLRFGWHRFLRIMPGFWVCLLVVAFVVAPVAAVLQGSPLATPFQTAPTSWDFVRRNAALLIQQYDIGGLLANNPEPFVFDGSLWTLALEAMCYVVLALLGWLGLTHRRRWTVLLLIGPLWSLLALRSSHAIPAIGDDTTRLLLMFLLGVSCYLFADRIPMGPVYALGALAVVVVGLGLLADYRVLGAPAFAYLIVYLGAGLPWPVRLRSDLSFGIYIYHWPVQQILMLTIVSALPTLLFVPVSLLVLLVPAAASWFLVEQRALEQKDFTPLRWLRASRAAPEAKEPAKFLD